MQRLWETRVKKRAVYLGNSVSFFVDQVRLSNGRIAEREYLSHPGAVGVLPILGRDTVVMVRQFRHPVREITYEIPAGKLARGEAPSACVRRELREETGFTARRMTRLLSYWPTPAFSDELLHLFVATDLRAGPKAPDEDEFLETEHIPFSRALDWVFTGKIRDSKTVIALLAYSKSARRKQ